MVEQEDMVGKVLDQWVNDEVPPKAPSLPIVFDTSFPHNFAITIASLPIWKLKKNGILL